MFEDTLSQGGWLDSLRENPPLVLVYLGGIPFSIPWILHPWYLFHSSLWTGFVMQVYWITAFVFVLRPFDTERANIKKRWFWKAMLTQGALLHLLFMGGLLFLDAKFPLFIGGTGTVFLMVVVVAGVEATHMKSIVDRSRPNELGTDKDES
jgi:hypothetical protein